MSIDDLVHTVPAFPLGATFGIISCFTLSNFVVWFSSQQNNCNYYAHFHDVCDVSERHLLRRYFPTICPNAFTFINELSIFAVRLTMTLIVAVDTQRKHATIASK